MHLLRACLPWLMLAGLAAAAPPLTISPEGQLMRDGQPYRAFGVNYFDAFLRTVGQPEDTSYDDGFRVLSEHGVVFARFAACGFWPVDWQGYRDDKDAWFKRLDGVVRSAEQHGIGLIPSLFWADATVPDMVGEPRGAWGDPESKSNAFMRTYVTEVVTRYLDSPAIWAWEFGNEYNLAADLPNAAQHRPRVIPRLGTGTERSEKDDVTTAQLVVMLQEFGQAVRSLDAVRPITSGNSIPRPSSWHQRAEKSWTKDTRAQFGEILSVQNPDPLNLISVHIYPQRTGQYFGDQEVGIDGLVAGAVGAAATAGKPLLVGEFGSSGKDGAEVAREQFNELLTALVKHEVALAAAWVYDRQPKDSFNITGMNDRAWMLDALGAANRAVAAAR